MGENFWTYFSALISIGFGWFLNELSQIIRTRQSDKRIKKKVLFNLLETLYIFKKLDISATVDFVTNAVLKKIPREGRTAELKTYMANVYTEQITEYVEQEVSVKLLDLEEEYIQAIEDLALVDPLSAYRLRGKNGIVETFKDLGKFYKHAELKFPEGREEFQKQSQTLMEYMKPELLKDSIRDLEEETTDIAWSIGIITWYKSKHTIKNSGAIDKNLQLQMDDLLEKLLPKLTSQPEQKMDNAEQ